MTWLEAVQTFWPLLAAAPGMIAFVWQWRDRKESRLAAQPFIEVLAMNPPFGPPVTADGWKALFVTARNDRPVPVRIVSAKVLRPRGVILQPSALSVPAQPRGAGREVALRWILAASSPSDAEGNSDDSVLTILVSRTSRALRSPTSITIEFTAFAMTNNSSRMRITSTVRPIEIPVSVASATHKNAY